MDKDEQKNIHTDYDKLDPISLFMFGGRRSALEPKTENEQPIRSTENTKDHKKHISSNEWLFGRRNSEFVETNKQDHNEQLNELLNRVNVEELFGNIDNFMTSVSHFKPIWKKITPIINKWTK